MVTAHKEHKEYLKDRNAVMLLGVTIFLALLAIALIVFGIASTSGSNYIVRYRANLGIDAFKSGGLADILSFVAYIVLVTVAQAVLSIKAYPINKRLSFVILGFGMLLLILAIIVSSALLAVH
jgi:DMSO/TMAO reductase YedYZ heme-binding membrane subunit